MRPFALFLAPLRPYSNDVDILAGREPLAFV